MKKLEKAKRIFALLGAIFLANLYLISLLFSFMKAPWAKDWLMASLIATVILAVLLYAMILVQRVLKNKKDE